MTCGCSALREPGGFSNFPEYEEHKRRVIESGLFVPALVRQQYADVGGVDEAWYECRTCGRIWRLVEPDPPFKGVWGEV